MAGQKIVIIRILHLIKRIRNKTVLFLVNKVFAGTAPRYFEIKRCLLNLIGFELGSGTKVVGPIECTGKLKVGNNCWIGKNLRINGNGRVEIGDNCDIAPEVTFQTGGHEIGDSSKRAGKGITCSQCVGDGVWIGGRATIVGNITIGNGSVIAGCACVIKSVAENTLVGGVPARVIRILENEENN